MLTNHCPVCGSKHNTVKVVSWPILAEMHYYEEDGIPVNSFSLIGVDDKGEGCCSYHDFEFPTREAADVAAAKFDHFAMMDYEQDCTEERMACDDEHGYFMDYGPVDSDPYD